MPPAQKRRKPQQSASPYSTRNRNSQAPRDHASTCKTQKPLTEAQKYKELAHQAKELNIVFHPGKFSDGKQQSQVPHQQKFKDIQTLGQLKFDTYGLQPSPESSDKPWQLVNKKRAEVLRTIAQKCISEKLNEDGWRHKLEVRMFERFEIEVACKRCRKRLWQSEIQADQSASNSARNSLKERQARRKPCNCEFVLALYDVLDHGLSNMFSSRIGEKNFSISDSVDFDVRTKKPDRVHGLQSTEFLEKIIESLDDTTIQTSCNPENSESPLRFPFLVMEAKSGKASCSFEKIETQTALPIKNMLELQQKLQVKSFKMSIPEGPLVWFLANKGEEWRVYGCYVTSSKHGSQIWNIIRLWDGKIDNHDAALQLVLIIDYILDWARDIYRPSIIRQLMSAAGVETRSLCTIAQDPDNVSAWVGGQDRYTAIPTGIANLNNQNAMHVDGNPNDVGPLQTNRYGMIRCCKILESQVLGLYIHADNLGTIIQGFSKPSDATDFFGEILKFFVKGNKAFVLPNTKALIAMEDAWASGAASPPTLTNSISRIVVSVQIRFRVSEQFELIQELNYLAITKEAWMMLCSKLPTITTRLDDLKSVSEENLVSKIREEKEVSKNNILTRCIQRHVFFQHARNLRFKRDARLKVHIGKVGEAVASTYKKYKIGLTEPEQTFLRRQSQKQVVPCQTGNPTSMFDNHEALVYNAHRRRFCLFTVPQECGRSTSDRRVRTIVSKFTLEEQVFVVEKTKGWLTSVGSEANSSSVRLGQRRAWMYDMLEWIISIQPSDTHFDQVRREIKDESLFDLLVQFRKKCWGNPDGRSHGFELIDDYIEAAKKGERDRLSGNGDMV